MKYLAGRSEILRSLRKLTSADQQLTQPKAQGNLGFFCSQKARTMTTALPTRQKKKAKVKVKVKEELPTTIERQETVVFFEESFKYPGTNRMVTFDGPQFQEWAHKTLPVSRGLEPMSQAEATHAGIKIDDFVFYLLRLPLYRWGSRYEGMGFFGGMFLPTDSIPIRNKLEVYRGKQHGYCGFSTPINIPVLAKPDQFVAGKLNPWMSLTPSEVMTQRGQIRRAKKDTAMAGLGLGWAARKVLERKQVKHLTVYEKSQGVIDYFGASLLEDYPDKVTLVCADAYDVSWKAHDVVLWDIWDAWGDASWDRKFEKIKKGLEDADKVCVGWGQGARE